MDPSTLNFWTVFLATGLPSLVAGWVAIGALATGVRLLASAIAKAIDST